MSDLYQVEFDIQFTRMKRFHAIRDPDGKLVWRAARLTEIIQWLLDRDQTKFELELEGDLWLCQIDRPATPGTPD